MFVGGREEYFGGVGYALTMVVGPGQRARLRTRGHL